MTKTETKITEAPKGCRFPVAVDKLCGRKTVPASGDPDGRGRPSNYCDNPQHNRASAWRARQAFVEQQTGVQEPEEVLSRPVTSAGARAGQFLDETRALAEALTQAQDRLLRELAVFGDADATAVELATVTADAEEQLAIERRRAAQAEAGRREDRARMEEADAAAGELLTELETLRFTASEELDALREASDEQLGEVRAELAEAERNLAAVEAQNAEQDEALNEARLANAAQFSEIERLSGELQAEEERSTTLAQSVEVLNEIKEGLDTDLIRAQEENRYLTEQLEKVTGERDEQRRRSEAAERETTVLTTQVTRLNEEVAELRSAVRERETEAKTATTRAHELSTERAGTVAQLEAAKQALAAEQNHANQRVGDVERAYQRQLDELRETITQLRKQLK